MSTAEILVVDDDRDLQEVMAMVLELGGYVASRAESGTAALLALDQIARQVVPPPCLVLLDLMLPDMRGEDVYRGMQALALPPLPAVVMSAAAEGPARAQHMGLPFLSKPFSMEALLDIVRRHHAG